MSRIREHVHIPALIAFHALVAGAAVSALCWPLYAVSWIRADEFVAGLWFSSGMFVAGLVWAALWLALSVLLADRSRS
jgi:hypothetical protein